MRISSLYLFTLLKFPKIGPMFLVHIFSIHSKKKTKNEKNRDNDIVCIITLGTYRTGGFSFNVKYFFYEGLHEILDYMKYIQILP